MIWYVGALIPEITWGTTPEITSKELQEAFDLNPIDSRGFQKEVLKMEKEANLVLAALRAKKFKQDIVKSLKDEEGDLVMSILAQRDADSFEPPEEYADLKALYETHAYSPKELYEALLEWKFNKILEMEGDDPFHQSKIQGAFMRLKLKEEL